MKEANKDTEVRRCSSCKVKLALSMFEDGSSSHVYKTCISCRYKKKLKYYCDLICALPDRIASTKRVGSKKSKRNANKKSIDSSDTSPNPGSSIPLQKKEGIDPLQGPTSICACATPQSKWVPVPFDPSIKVVMASVVGNDFSPKSAQRQ